MLWYFVIVTELNKTDGTNDIGAAASGSFTHDSGVRSTKGLMFDSQRKKLELELSLAEGIIRSLGAPVLPPPEEERFLFSMVNMWALRKEMW